eukprot:907736-Amphidinium_carterae.2
MDSDGVEATGCWRQLAFTDREMLYVQLPKEGAKDAGKRHPMALLPQVCLLWCALCRHDVKAWRATCTARGEVLVERGALDETFDLAYETEQTTAAGILQAGIFPDCSVEGRQVTASSHNYEGSWVDTQWAAGRCQVQRKHVIMFRQSMHRVRSLGLPAHSKARIVKSLYSVGLYGAEFSGMLASHMNVTARKALGKGASLRRSNSLELMAFGGPAGDPQDTTDLNCLGSTQLIWHAGLLQWPLEEWAWGTALAKGRGRGPIRHLRLLADRLGWVLMLLQREDLSHIMFRCARWHKERRQVELPADDEETPACVKLHGMLPAPQVPAVTPHELRGSTALELAPSGLMDQEGTVVILNIAGVESAITLTCKRAHGYHSRALSNRCTALSLLQWYVLLQSVNHTRWSVLAKAW